MSQQTTTIESRSISPSNPDNLKASMPGKAAVKRYLPIVGLLFAIAALVVLGLLVILRPFDVSFTVGASVGANFAVIATACFLLCFPSYKAKPVDTVPDYPDCNPSNAQTIERIVLIILLMFCIGALTLLAMG